MKEINLNTQLICTLDTVLFCHTSDLIRDTSIASTTWYNLIQKPDSITIKQLLAIANGLCIPVRRLFSDSCTHYIGHRDEYVISPYKECYYDSDRLQNIVNDLPGITWKRAAKAVGMTRQRLRDSLLAVTRTPVNRFLAVCKVFQIDPFTILVDPNPEMKATKPSTAKGGEADIRADIAALHRQIDQLTDTIADLASKYELLLTEQKRLAQRIQSNFQNIPDRYSTLVAEPGPGEGNEYGKG